MKLQQCCEPRNGKLGLNFPQASILDTISISVNQENIGKISPRSKIEKTYYIMPSFIVYPQYDLRWWNTKFFINPKFVSWYDNFLGV